MSSNQQLERAERLQIARKAANYDNPTDAARAMGVPPPTYLGHENGSRGFTESAERYADFFRVNFEWLWRGRGQMKSGAPQDRTTAFPTEGKFNPAEKGSRGAIVNTVPSGLHEPLKVLGMAECGPDGWSMFNGEVVDYVPRPANLNGVADAFAVFITGLSNFPRYNPGEIAHIHPHKPVTIGAWVLVQKKPEVEGDTPKAVIKQLKKRSGNKVILEQLNPPKTFELKADEITMYRIVGSAEY